MRHLEELKEKIEWSLNNLNKCHIGNDSLDRAKLGDSLMFSISMTYVSQAIEKGLITEKEAFERITKTEEEVCSQ